MSSPDPLRPPLLLRWQRAAASLDLTPADLAGLALLLSGAVAALLSLWLLARPAVVPAQPTVAFAAPDATAAPSPGDATELTVHVAGHVAAPGVYRLPAGSRVTDALQRAGEPLPDAVVDAVNLARPLVDGEQLLVPGPGAPPASAEPSGGAHRPDGTLDLNLATVDDLDELPGIGPVLAERIVAYRTEHGPFPRVDALREVRGIGERTFQDLAPLLAT